MKTNQKIVFAILGTLAIANVLLWIEISKLPRPHFLEVTFFDIGQGDAVFIETPEGHQILIDGGPDSKIIEKLAKEMPFWDRDIDLIILTHPEHDHIAGLIKVLKRYKIDYVLWTGIVRETDEFEEWLSLIKEEGSKIIIAESGQRIIFAKSSPTQSYEVGLPKNYLDGLHIIYPFEDLENKEMKNSNNSSIVSLLVFGGNSFIFTGDIYKSVEKELIEKGIYLDSDVLKVAHHGSKTSSSEEFIKTVSPEIAVIQCGENNRYGHPHPEVLEILEKSGIKILRTDQNGDIKIVSDGRKTKYSLGKLISGSLARPSETSSLR